MPPTSPAPDTAPGPARNPATVHILQFFQYGHLPPGLQAVSGQCANLAQDMVRFLPDGPELTAGLRKLLEAKDCFVRAALARRDG